MGEEEVQETTQEEIPQETQETAVEETQEENPAWSELLSVVPEMFQSQVTPHLQKLDQTYQSQIQELQSRFDPYKPYVENNVQPSQIDYAMNVLRAVEERPAEVIKALQAYMGVTQEETPEEETTEEETSETDVPDELFSHPKFQQMEQMLQTMAQHFVQQRQSEADMQAEKELTEELESLRNQHGDFDDDDVLRRAIANPNASLEDCVKAHQEFVQGILTQNNRPKPPPVLSGNGTAPSNQVTPDKLNDPKVRKALVADMLRGVSQS